MPGELIVADFLVGPANPKDWVGLYKVDMIPGDVGSLAWFYVDGTKDGTEGVSTGAITFDSGMADDGDYKAVFFEDDGYTILAETIFKAFGRAFRYAKEVDFLNNGNKPPSTKGVL